MIMKMISTLGDYCLLTIKVFQKPQKWKIFKKNILREINDLGVNSVGLVSFLAFFVGAIVAIQMYNNFDASAFPIPNEYVGYATKVVLILEFCPTIISIILAGKVGSYVASSIGTMRITEQIDALEIMGINTPSYLILPKIIASLICNVILIMLSLVIGVFGGYVAGIVTGKWTAMEYIKGLQAPSPDFFIWYCLIKTFIFAFFIASISSYYGYSVKGGSLNVGTNSTLAVVWTTVCILISDLLLTQLLL